MSASQPIELVGKSAGLYASEDGRFEALATYAKSAPQWQFLTYTAGKKARQVCRAAKLSELCQEATELLGRKVTVKRGPNPNAGRPKLEDRDDVQTMKTNLRYSANDRKQFDAAQAILIKRRSKTSGSQKVRLSLNEFLLEGARAYTDEILSND